MEERQELEPEEDGTREAKARRGNERVNTSMRKKRGRRMTKEEGGLVDKISFDMPDNCAEARELRKQVGRVWVGGSSWG